MLLLAVSVALLIVSCASQTIIQGPAWGTSSYERCSSRADAKYISDLRKQLFGEFNKIRRKVANGAKVFPNDTYQKEEKLMYAMVYKCDLENTAFELLTNGKTSHRSYVVLNYTSVVRGGNYYPTSQVIWALNKWKTDEVAQSMFVYPIVPYFGCGYSYENYLLKLICVFDKDSRYYRRSLPCGHDSVCRYAVPSDHYMHSLLAVLHRAHKVLRDLLHLEYHFPPHVGVPRRIRNIRRLGKQYSALNYLRQMIAKGEKVFGNMQNQTGPKLMYGLRYSCPLEKIASKLLQNGQTEHANFVVFSYSSEMHWEGRRLFPAIQLEHVFRQMIADKDTRDTLLYSYVSFFGCAYSYQKDKQPRALTLLCVLYRDSERTPRRAGRPCSDDADCTRYRNSTCSKELCWAPTVYNASDSRQRRIAGCFVHFIYNTFNIWRSTSYSMPED
ncbi:hypothetical protein Q1695_004219 [Nippostrongylus brasiliensis]|nr:hypothetical protein Q1695_004219 [Nippostrongylus brasiliensis]